MEGVKKILFGNEEKAVNYGAIFPIEVESYFCEYEN